MSRKLKRLILYSNRQGVLVMKKEDLWMIILVGFSILWVTAFGVGLFG